MGIPLLSLPDWPALIAAYLLEDDIAGDDLAREDPTCGVCIEAGRRQGECFSIVVIGIVQFIADRGVGLCSDAAGIEVECAVGIPALCFPGVGWLSLGVVGCDLFKDNVGGIDVSREDAA